MRVIILLFLIIFQLSASEVIWHKSYKDALESSKQNNKLVFVFITSSECLWCKRFKKTTLREAEIVKRMNSEYNSVELTKDVDEYPKKLKAAVLPMYYFLDSDENIIDYSRGYWDKTDFNFVLDDVQKRLKKQRKK